MSLLSQYKGVVCDLDGVVYAGPVAIPHAVEALTSAAQAGLPIVYATNNASRPPASVAQHLRSLELDLEDGDVINSSMAGSHVLTQIIETGSPVLAIGGEGVKLALEAGGFRVVLPAQAAGESEIAAVLQGYGPEVKASDLAEAAYAIADGATWVATNTDKTLPTDRGVAPGNGSLIAAVQMAVTNPPLVVGKPEPVMYVMASERMRIEPQHVIAIGDRLETDIEGAVKAGMPSVLVLTGVHGFGDAAGAPVELRPIYVLADLRGLQDAYVVGEPLAWNDEAKRFSGVADSIEQLRACLLECWRMVDDNVLTPNEARTAMEALS